MDVGGIKKRIAAADYLSVAQIYLQDNFLLERPLEFSDIKPRLLGHWGTCHGISVAYELCREVYKLQLSNLSRDSSPGKIPPAGDFSREFRTLNSGNLEFIVGPGHGFPALQANLFLDGTLQKYYPEATLDEAGVAYVCRNFSWPYGFPSHSFPGTPGVILEGGELGYSLATAYGAALGRPEKIIACLIGDGELETGTALASLNLNKLIDSTHNGLVLPILHLNGYKISGPTIYGRKSDRELLQLVRGFGFEPVIIEPDVDLEEAIEVLKGLTLKNGGVPFVIMKTEKGEGGPREVNGEKIAGNYLSHQVPLPLCKTDEGQLRMLEKWLRSYGFSQDLLVGIRDGGCEMDYWDKPGNDGDGGDGNDGDGEGGING